MKRENGLVQFGAGLVLFLSFVLVLPGCAKVYVECAPPNAMNEDGPPGGVSCKLKPGGGCMSIPVGCTCRS